jgi:sugar phosphate isomerase/epimerase
VGGSVTVPVPVLVSRPMSAPHSISRRTFLAIAGALPFAARASAAFKDVPVGLELYSVRDELAKDLNGTVTAVAKMGYKIVEFYSPYFNWTPEQAKDVRKLLDDLGLQCRSTHNGGPSFTSDGLKKAIELNQIIGSKYIIMASPGGKIADADGWKSVADTLTRAAEQLRPIGMATGYHNHQAEWAPVGGKRAMDIIAAGTPKDLALQFDIGTCLEAGADPVEWIKANPGRIRSMHCKEWSKSHGYGSAFAEGDAPWKQILDAAETTGGIEYYLIEQETSPEGAAIDMAKRCLENYKKLRA